MRAKRLCLALLLASLTLMCLTSCSGNSESEPGGENSSLVGGTDHASQSTTVGVAGPEASSPEVGASSVGESLADPGDQPGSVVNVYFMMTFDGPSPERIVAGGRRVTGVGVARAALSALLAGPNQADLDAGSTTQIPQGTHLLDVDIAGGVATVDLSGEFEESGDTLSETARLAQVVFTLTQFSTVDSVSIRIDGESRDTILSHGLGATGLSRESFNDSVRPEILVNRPYPGEVVDPSGITISGEARVFEATVSLQVSGSSEREPLFAGFATASIGAPEWGDFSKTVDVSDAFGAAGANVLSALNVVAFEESAEDGHPVATVVVPVVVHPGA